MSTLTIRIDDETKDRLELLSKAADRTKSYLLPLRILSTRTIGGFRLRDADSADAEFAAHDEVAGLRAGDQRLRTRR